MNILITGGAGFIGSNLADELLHYNNQVFIIDNFNNYYPIELKRENVACNINNPNYRIFEGDILDIGFLDYVFKNNQIDCVVHLAGCGGVRPSIVNPVGYINSNIIGTVNILEKMKEYEIKKIVFASSSSVYGDCSSNEFCEDFNVSPISPYAATKSSCEEFLHVYSKLYNIQAIALRFFTVFGPRQRPDLAIRKFIDLILENKPIPVYGDGTSLRDYTYIDDIISGIIKSINYNKTNYEIFNLGANNPISLHEMIRTIEEELGKKAIIEHYPMQAGDVFKTSSDTTKAKNLLGYTPQVTFREGIRKFIAWSKKAKKPTAVF